MTESKNDTISKIYYEHFGSIKRTLKEAREINPDIKEKDIKAWKSTELPRKINLTGNNSFVASRPREEFQVPSGSLHNARLDPQGHEEDDPRANRPSARNVQKSKKKEGWGDGGRFRSESSTRNEGGETRQRSEEGN